MSKVLFWIGFLLLAAGALVAMNATWSFVPEAAATGGLWQSFKETLKAAGSYMADHTRLLNRIGFGLGIALAGIGFMLAAVYGMLERLNKRLDKQIE